MHAALLAAVSTLLIALATEAAATVDQVVVERNVEVPMRDGTILRADVFRPDNHNTPADQNADATLVTAEQTIHHGPPHGSKFILPTVRNTAEQ